LASIKTSYRKKEKKASQEKESENDDSENDDKNMHLKLDIE